MVYLCYHLPRFLASYNLIFTVLIVFIAKPKQSFGYEIKPYIAYENLDLEESSEAVGNHLRRRMKVSETNDGANERITKASRPVVYTFFNRIDDHFSSNKYDRGMISAWFQSWFEMGWEPRILTIEDAKKHPRYEEYNKALDNVQLDTRAEFLRPSIVEYNRLCYLRWLAMAAVGGGFMSDYDTIAVSPPKAGDEKPEKFTLYDRICPDVMSGSASEWERLAWLILDHGIEHTKAGHGFASDMMSLGGVYNNDTCDCQTAEENPKPVTDAVVPLIDRNDFTQRDCDYFKKIRAVHFSHYSVSKAYKRNVKSTYGFEPRDERPDIMKKFFSLYKASCLVNKKES